MYDVLNIDWNQKKILEAENKYSNGKLVMRHLARNTSKYYRVRTEGEKAADITYTLITEIERIHERLCVRHGNAISKAGEREVDGKSLDHLNLNALDAIAETNVNQFRTDGDPKARVRLSSVMPQLLHAYTSTGDHYHTSGITDASRQDAWLPGFQGVSVKYEQ